MGMDLWIKPCACEAEPDLVSQAQESVVWKGALIRGARFWEDREARRKKLLGVVPLGRRVLLSEAVAFCGRLSRKAETKRWSDCSTEYGVWEAESLSKGNELLSYVSAIEAE